MLHGLGSVLDRLWLLIVHLLDLFLRLLFFHLPSFSSAVSALIAQFSLVDLAFLQVRELHLDVVHLSVGSVLLSSLLLSLVRVVPVVRRVFVIDDGVATFVEGDTVI